MKSLIFVNILFVVCAGIAIAQASELSFQNERADFRKSIDSLAKLSNKVPLYCTESVMGASEESATVSLKTKKASDFKDGFWIAFTVKGDGSGAGRKFFLS